MFCGDAVVQARRDVGASWNSLGSSSGCCGNGGCPGFREWGWTPLTAHPGRGNMQEGDESPFPTTAAGSGHSQTPSPRQHPPSLGCIPSPIAAIEPRNGLGKQPIASRGSCLPLEVAAVCRGERRRGLEQDMRELRLGIPLMWCLGREPGRRAGTPAQSLLSLTAGVRRSRQPVLGQGKLAGPFPPSIPKHPELSPMGLASVQHRTG